MTNIGISLAYKLENIEIKWGMPFFSYAQKLVTFANIDHREELEHKFEATEFFLA